MSLTSCPSREELVAFSLGKLPVQVLESVAAHLAACPTCESALSQLGAVPDSFLSSLDQSLAAGPFADEPACRAAVARFAAVGRQQPSFAGDPAAALPAPGGRLGYYDLLEKLGKGGMGTVFKARHRKLDKLFALKVLPAERMRDADAVARFEREIQAIGKLDHPHIVRATDAGEVDGTHFLVMEFVEGTDLARLVRQLGCLPLPEACELIRQAALGLQHVAEHGLVHRDVKPSNLLLTRDGQVKIADLGLALLQSIPAKEADLTGTGMILGTLDYLAPEQAFDTHNVDIRADLYSLGCTLYHLLAGQAPFSGPEYHNALRKTLAHAQVPVPALRRLRPEVPEALAALVQRLLAKDPAERFARPADLAAALQPFTVGSDLPGLLAAVLPAPLPVELAQARTVDGSERPTPPVATWGAPLSQAAVAARSTATVPATPPAPVRPSARRPLIRTGLVVALLLLGLAGVPCWIGLAVYRITTNQGVLVIQTDDPDVQVAVKRNGEEVTILDPLSKQEVTLAAGAYEFELKPGKEGLKLRTTHFTLERNGRKIVEVYRETPTVKAVPGTGKKQAAPQVVITPEERRLLPAGAPLSPIALVGHPARLPGVQSWTIETRSHRGGVYNALAFSPNGRWLASGGEDGTIRLWDSVTGRLEKMLVVPHDLVISSLAFSPDGRWLAAGSLHNTVPIFEVASGRLERTLKRPMEVGKFTRRIRDRISWSKDGQRIAMVSSLHGLEGQFQVQLWEAATGKSIQACPTSGYDVAFSPDGKTLATGGGTKRLTFSNSVTGEFRKHVELPEAILCLSWSPDSKILATANKDGNFRLLDVALGQPPRIIPARVKGAVSFLAWSPDGKAILAGDRDSVSMWDVTTLQSRFRHKISGEPHAVAWSPDGASAVVATGTDSGDIQLCDAMTGKLLQTVSRGFAPSYSMSLTCTPDGRTVALGFPGMVRLLDTASGLQRASLLADEYGFGLDFGFGLAFDASGQRLALTNYAGGTQIIELRSRKALRTLPDRSPTRMPTRCAWAPDQRRLAASTAGHVVKLWDVETGKELHALKGHTNRIYGLAWSPNGERLASGGDDRTVRIWNTTMGKLFLKVDLPSSRPFTLAWSPDGKLLAVRDLDKPATLVLDTASGKVLRTLECSSSAFSWSTDSKQLVTSGPDRVVRCWEVALGKQVREVPGWGGLIGTSPADGHLLVAAGPGPFPPSAVRLWETATGRLLLTYVALPDDRYVTLSGDGHYQGSPQIEDELLYIVLTDAGEQLTLTPAEFAQRYAWKNDPEQVGLR